MNLINLQEKVIKWLHDESINLITFYLNCIELNKSLEHELFKDCINDIDLDELRDIQFNCNNEWYYSKKDLLKNITWWY